MFYKKKPVTIEAVQFTKEDPKAAHFFAGGSILTYENSSEPSLLVRTLEGDMKASIGDYIIKGVDGEFYPCKPQIFEKTYELVDKLNQNIVKETSSKNNFDYCPYCGHKL